jgi:acetyl/propionyl-CoA carboxylase alpha subunit
VKYVTTVGDCTFTIEINREDEITVNGQTHQVSIEPVGNSSLFSLIIDNVSYDAFIYKQDERYLVLLQGELFEVEVEDERDRLSKVRRGPLIPAGDIHVKAPIPGIVSDVPVVEGQTVAQGDVMIVLESMKMQNEFRAPRDGIVQSIRVAPGDRVNQGQVMLTIR